MSFSSNLVPLVRVFNTPVAANFSVVGGKLVVNGLGVSPDYEAILASPLQVSRRLQLNRFSLTFSASASSVHSFIITSTDSVGNVVSTTVSYTSPVTGFSNAAVAAAIVGQVTELIAQGKIPSGAVSGTGSPVSVAGYGISLVAQQGIVVATANTTYAPDGTAANAIVDSLAPSSTATVAVAGTTTVTITTAAAHGLLPGDVVDLGLSGGSTGTLFFDLRPGANQTGSTGVANVIVATVPSATEFTLQQVQAGGGTYDGTNNNRDLAIRTKNVVRVVTNAAHDLLPGNAVTVADIATFTVNGGASFTSVVRSVPTTTSLVLFGQGNGSASNANTGTITITEVGQNNSNTGSLIAAGSGGFVLATGSDALVSGNRYTKFEFVYGNRITDSISVPRRQANKVTLYLNEGAAGYGASMKVLGEILNNWQSGTTLANAAANALV
jgi:hypothetical protein